MDSGVDDFPDSSLEDVAYLSRSESRGRILAALTMEPRSSGELSDYTGIARTTVSRIVNEFEDRGWAERRSDGKYATTPAGVYVVNEYKPFLQSMEAIGKLGNLVAWLPTDEVSIDIKHFAEATITRPNPTDPTSAVTDFNARLEGVSEFRCIVGIAPPVQFEREMRDAVVERELDTEHVITEEELNYLHNNPERLSRWQKYVEAGANVYCYDGQLPCFLFIFDETVLIFNTKSEYGEPRTAIESTNDTILAWAHQMIEKYRNESKRLDSTAFSAD